MHNQRFDRQLSFLIQADRMKNVLRQTLLADGSRQETDAEHSWHLALTAMALYEYRGLSGISLDRVIRMALVHDLVEIYAGDTFCYDETANQDKAQREKEAADRLFGTLPEDQGVEYRKLWEEFDAMETADARYAACMDRLQPFLHNTLTDGHTWVESGTDRAAVEKRMAVVKEFLPEVYEWVSDNIEEAVRKGWLS